MRNGKYSSRKASHVKPLVLLLTLVLVIGCAVGGTIAWLTANTDPVVNTFTVGNINIDLAETTEDYKMIPGNDIAKDPIASVLKGSEASWLFVKVEETKNLSDYIEYEIADGWTEYTDTNTIPTIKYYYRAVVDLTKAAEDAKFPVLKDNKVHVSEEVTKQMMDSLTADVYPKLIFEAAAIQSANIETVEEAWANLPDDFKK